MVGLSGVARLSASLLGGINPLWHHVKRIVSSFLNDLVCLMKLKIDQVWELIYSQVNIYAPLEFYAAGTQRLFIVKKHSAFFPCTLVLRFQNIL